VLRALTMH